MTRFIIVSIHYDYRCCCFLVVAVVVAAPIIVVVAAVDVAVLQVLQ